MIRNYVINGLDGSDGRQFTRNDVIVNLFDAMIMQANSILKPSGNKYEIFCNCTEEEFEEALGEYKKDWGARSGGWYWFMGNLIKPVISDCWGYKKY